MRSDWSIVCVSNILEVTDYVANGSFESLKKNVSTFDTPSHAILIRLVDYNAMWSGPFKWIDESSFKFLTKSIVHPNDIIISNVGNAGTVFKAPDLGVPMSLGPNSILLKSEKTKNVNTGYIYYFFVSNFGQYLISTIIDGSAQPKFNKTNFRKLEIPLPPLAEQKRIAALLGSLDDLIENTRKMNEILEEMAQAIFKSWFIDFDGVPEEDLVESELGLIPRGWEVAHLSDNFNLTMGLSPPSSTYNEEGKGLLFFQGARDFNDRFPTPRVYCTDPKRVANPLDTLISVRAPVGIPNMALEKCCIGRGVAALIHKSGSSSYTYAVAKNLEKQFETFNGEGTVFGSINKEAFLKLKLLAPPAHMIEKFSLLVGGLDQLILNNTKQIQTLSELRDTLLPKLISGELRIPEAEKIVEDLL